MPPRISRKTREALIKLASGPQDMRDDALLQLISDEMKKLDATDVAYIRDRVRFSCPPCPVVVSVVDMLNGMISLKEMAF